MNEKDFNKLKIGDVVTRTVGPNKGVPVKVIKKTDGIPGLFPPEIKAIVYNSEDILYVGKKKKPSKVMTGAASCFKLLYVPKDISALQRRHITDQTRKLVPAWEYYSDRYDECERDFAKVSVWNKIRLLTCEVYGVSVVKDIPDESVPDAILTAKEFVDLFFKLKEKANR